MARYNKPEVIEKYWFETFGCQMNIAESDALEMQLRGIGLTSAESCEEADIAILNTCSVRKSAENRVWGRIGNYSRIKSDRAMILIVTGCMAERLIDDLKKSAPHIDYVLGTNDKQKIIEIASGNKNFNHEDNYQFLDNYYREGDVSTFVPIMNGCNNFCTYCIVPYVRGRECSRKVEDILTEVKFLSSKGVKEITLLGQNVNSYSYEEENGEVIGFPQLLEKVAHVAGDIEWIRFESPHPKDFSDELIQVIKKEEKVAKHLHIPLQSGNSRILKLMNRRYTREKFITLIEKIKSEIPEVTFATDVMVGFPGETDEELQDTQSILDIMRCGEAFMYYWNPREGTPAVKMEGQISDEIKIARLQGLIDHQQVIFKEQTKVKSHGVHHVLVTRISRDDKSQLLARGEHNEMVAFNHNNDLKIGDIAVVEYFSVKGKTIIGKQI